TAGGDELVEHVAHPERRIGNPAVVGEREAGPGGRLLGLERAEVGPRVQVRRRRSGRETPGEEPTGGVGTAEGAAGEADSLGAEEQRRREALPLLPEVGGVLLGL